MSSDLDGAAWRKSSYSGSNGGECVEMAIAGRTTGVRDSKNPKAELAFGQSELSRFLGAVKHGRFDA
ncbi:MAG: DUF397 domain-containing protein [Umezawaea sp.]